MKFLIGFEVFFPMAAGVISYLLGKYRKNVRDYFAEAATVLTFAVMVFLVAGFLKGSTVEFSRGDVAGFLEDGAAEFSRGDVAGFLEDGTAEFSWGSAAGSIAENTGRLVNGNGISENGITLTLPGVCGLGLHFALDGFRALYGTVTAFVWMMSTLFSKEYFAHYRNRNRYYLFLLLTLGAVMGVFFSADFYTTFIFFEVMSFTSYVWVVHDEKKESLRAAGTYLAVSVMGGLVMLMGIFLLYELTGTLMFTDLQDLLKQVAGTADLQGLLKQGAETADLQGLSGQVAGAADLQSLSGQVAGTLDLHGREKLWAAGLCMLFGFGAKAGAFPLHIWLPKAHPVAPAPASALLSGILTKAGVFGILVLSSYLFFGNGMWGSMLLLIGVCTMAAGAALALFSVDLKRTLACSSVSQIGFILTGLGLAGLLGEANGLAIRGTLLHMVNHSLIKLVLFLAAGVVFMNVHKLNLNEIKGFGQKKPLLNAIFLSGALGIGGIPLFNGYVSKTLLHESILKYRELLESGSASGIFSESAMKGIEWIFLISGGLTVAYMTKLYVALFIEKNNDAAMQEAFDAQKGSYMNKTSGAVLAASAALFPIMGMFPNQVMGRLADMGQGFLQVKGSEAASAASVTATAAYFSFSSLKGSFLSIAMGILIYAVFVRCWMVKKEGGKTVYLDRWLPYLDLEGLIYRPILLRFLPFAGGVFCRVLDSFADSFVVMLRRTVYRDSKLPHELPEGNGITHMLGSLMKALEKAANATIFKKKKRNVDYAHKFALMYEELSEEKVIIGRSLSFGLLMFCLGLMITVGYLLFLRKLL